MNFLPAGAEGHHSDDSDEFLFGDDHEDIENDLIRRNGSTRRMMTEDLKVASSRGNLEEVQNLLERGMKVDTILAGGWTALMYSLHSGHASIARMLLERGADVDSCSSDGLFGPLLACCSSKAGEQKQLECLDLLLQHGVKMDVHDWTHMTPLMFACQQGHVKVTSKLILAKTEVNKQDNRGWTALCYAAMSGKEKLVKLLLDNGADPTKSCCDGTASDIAYGQGFTEISDMLDHLGDPSYATYDLPQSKETSNKSRLTSSAGDSASHYHFYDDLDLFLCGLDLSDLVPLFRSHQLDFAELLRLTEEDLEKMGIEQLGWRRKIMRSVHEIHKLRWERGSIRNPTTNVLSQTESLAILDNISQHLSYINSCLDYVHSNWSMHKTLCQSQRDGTGLCHLADVTNKLLLKMPKIQKSLQKLDTDVKQASQYQRTVAADLIVDPDSNSSSIFSSSSWFMILIGSVAMATTAFYLWNPSEALSLPSR